MTFRTPPASGLAIHIVASRHNIPAPKQLTALRCPRWCQRVLEIVPQICWILSQPGGSLLILEEVARKPARTYCNYIYAHIVNRYEYYCLRYHPTGVYYLQDATPTRCCHSLSQANEPTNAENFSMSEARTGMNVVTCQPRKNPLSFSLEIMADLLWRISKKKSCLKFLNHGVVFKHGSHPKCTFGEFLV